MDSAHTVCAGLALRRGPMAAANNWTVAFRDQVRDSTAAGWSVFPHRGQMRLQVRRGAWRPESVMLPYAWDKQFAADALLRIRMIYKQFCAGQTLHGAAAIVSESSSKTVHDWGSAISKFEQHKKEFGNAIADITWNTKYLPTLRMAADCLESRVPPSDASELLDAVLRRWKPGSRSRQIAAQNLAQFLTFCTDRLHFKACWRPPAKLAVYVGQKPRGTLKRDGYPLTDAQILRLLDGLPDNDSGLRWKFAVQLMATYGLRPEELRYLVIKPGVSGVELWCAYQKKGGGGQTMPRKLIPIPLVDIDGSKPEWNLLARLQVGENLPPLGAQGKAGEAANTYFNRQPIWRQLKEEVALTGEALVVYSLRHRYSAEGHRRSVPLKLLCDAMGHTTECHLRSYTRFTSPDATKIFADAQARFEAQFSQSVYSASVMPNIECNSETTATQPLQSTKKRPSERPKGSRRDSQTKLRSGNHCAVQLSLLEDA